jgi:hypothetical protein
MRHRSLAALLALVPALILALALGAPLTAATLAGVTMPDSITVAGKTLALNGMGVRSKLVIKVYVGGLYLEQKSTDAVAILQSDTIKRLVLHFIYSEVSKEQMAEAWSEGFAGNLPDKGKSLKPQIDQFLAAAETMKKDEQMMVTYVPGTGTTLTIRGRDMLTVPGAEFGRAVFGIWLGPKPPSGGLKNGLLGR